MHFKTVRLTAIRNKPKRIIFAMVDLGCYISSSMSSRLFSTNFLHQLLLILATISSIFSLEKLKVASTDYVKILDDSNTFASSTRLLKERERSSQLSIPPRPLTQCYNSIFLEVFCSRLVS